MRWLTSRLRTFFSSVLHTLGMPSQSSAYFEFEHKGQIPVDSYFTILQREYGHNPARRNVMRVREIHVVKELLRASEHEYVVAHVEVPDGQIMYLSFERLRGDVINTSDSDNMVTLPNSKQTSPESHRRSSSLSSPSPSSVSLASCNSFSKHRTAADDCVTSHQNPIKEAKDFDCGRLLFDDQKMLCLYELAILASSIHEDGSQYHLIGENCYYYAHLFVNVLESKYNVTFQPSESKAGKVGHWNGVFAHSHANLKTIARVRDILEANILEFNAMVNFGRLIIFIITNEIVLDGEGAG
jgi:hypothetical protein